VSLADRLVLEASGTLEMINTVARALYRRGLRQVHRAEVPVISVGNIVCGGSGKTPLVAALARHLVERGRRPAILTRGYKRKNKTPVLIMADREPRWQDAGDEPALLARERPGVPIVVDPDRVRGAATAVREAAADVLLLDDGFQHWRLHRDLDIVVVAAPDPFGSLSPRREPPAALKWAGAIVISKATDRPEALAAMAVVGPEAPEAYLMVTHMVPRRLHRGSQELPLSSLRDQPVHAVAGLASPESFVNTLGDLGARLLELRFFPDHHRYTRAEAEQLLAEAGAAGAWVVTTAKDVVKFPPELAAKASWLEVEAKPLVGSFDELLAPILTVKVA
jgi:tetraacyldisaccharide 4'-kinase